MEALAVDATAPQTLYASSGFTFLWSDGVFKSTDGGASWTAMINGLPSHSHSGQLFVHALVLDPSAPETLYAGMLGCPAVVFKSTDGGRSWSALNTGLPNADVRALAIAPTNPSTLYAATSGGVFSVQQVAVCVGDCPGTHTVAVNDVITLVNIALGNADPSVCPNGLPIGGDVNVAVIIQAVNNALNGCGG